MGEQRSEQAQEPADQRNDTSPGQTPEQQPEPDEKDKEKAAEMMTAYQDRPTLVLPGTGGAVSGTAVGDWLDEDGNPKYANDQDAPAAKSRLADDEKVDEEQIAMDKAFNEAVLKAAKARASGASGDQKADEKAVTS
jgi:hypothetical protein